MNEYPAPLTPADCDLRDFAFTPIDGPRLFGSSFHATVSDAGWRAGVTLWLKAWHQVPAASLPDDDIALARLAELGRDLRAWKKVKADALRSWVKCSDGRLYHPVVAEKALEAWLEKLVQRLSSGAGNAKRWGADFDPALIERQIDDASAMLAAIAPQSRAIAKSKRRHSHRDNTGKPAGTAAGTPERIPSGSQGTGTGTGTGNTPKPPNGSMPPGPAALPDDLRQVMEAGGFVSPPQDHGFLRQWQDAGARLDLDILPTVRRVAAAERERTGRAPFRLKLFDAAIREKLATDAAEIERLERYSKRRAAEDAAQRVDVRH